VGQATGAQLGASLTGYILTYIALFIAYMVVLTHMAGKGASPDDDPAVATRAAVPLAKAAE
jgi:cytochrome bd-type quinol oxidase subunit 1